jgi:hypothetical protein
VWHLFDAQQSVYARNWPGFVPVAPSAPAVGTVTLGTGSQAALLTATIPFTAGYNGGNTITRVTALSIPGNKTANTSGSSPITISGLTSNTNYTFAVYETNFYGDSPFGYSNPVTTPDVPQAPTIGTATLVGSSSANVAFTANGDGGTAITSFTAISTPGNITASGASSPVLVTGLASTTTYTFKVLATNLFGNSALSGASNSITTPNVISMDYLFVGGGGGGGKGGGGGGGAGGYITGTYSVSGGTTYAIAVGAGGASSSTTTADNGAPTTFNVTTFVANGGGGGGRGGDGVPNASTNGNGGGSGGGGGGYDSFNNRTGGSGNQGNSGGNGSATGGYYGGGGGGGYGSAGTAGNGTSAAAGGSGVANSISGASVTYAAGGAGSGASGGAGANATANTGNGAQAGSYSGNLGGTGGSGIAIISVSDTIAVATTTGSPTITTSGGKRIYKFTGSGSITF